MLRVHSVFDSTLNIEVEGKDILVALTGRDGAAYAHAVATDYEGNFHRWQVSAGDRGLVSQGAIVLLSGKVRVDVDLSRGRVRAPSVLPPCRAAGPAFRACEARLRQIQSEKAFDLQLACLQGEARPGTAMGDELCRAVETLGRTACEFLARPVKPQIAAAVASLLGRGRGLTPAGDDFLSGFLAALRCLPEPASDGAKSPVRDLYAELCGAIGRNLASTVEISASLLRCAMRSYWPQPLADIAAALGAGSEVGALRALGELCAFGHSSGADIATGFLYGLGLLARPEVS